MTRLYEERWLYAPVLQHVYLWLPIRVLYRTKLAEVEVFDYCSHFYAWYVLPVKQIGNLIIIILRLYRVN